ncbi:MAG: permease [Gemmatimonadetes bacterium]|nr:permease [Gemmatimonadota bacterium]
MSLDGFRVTVRTLRKQPVFSTVVILSLALAIALNTTMYSVLDALAHPRLDMRSPGHLYWVKFFGDYHGRVPNRERDAALTAGMHSYEAITRQSLGYGRSSVIEYGQNNREAESQFVGENYFDVLGPRVLAGRAFIPADSEASVSPAVISEDLATRLFPGSASAVGGTIQIDRVAHLVVGVVSSASNFPHERTAVWMIGPYPERGGFTRLIRLRDGVSRADAERELSVVSNRIAAQAGDSPKDDAFRFEAAADPEFQVRGFHYALILSVVAVLLVACANLANLQLARGISRRRDLALRSALGATRGRIVRHLMSESLLLAAVGLVTGLLFAYLGGRLLTASIPPAMGAFVAEPHMSWRVLAFALIATVACLVLIGVAPSVYVSRTDPNELLKSGAGTGATKRNRRRYGVLVGVEIALALVLASAAALAIRSALLINEFGTGYDTRPLSTGYAWFASGQGAKPRTYSERLQDITTRVRAVPGVVDATAQASILVQKGAITIEDAGGVREFPTPNWAVTTVSPSYLRTFQLPVLRGRDFFEGERDAGAVIIDDQTAHLLWPNANPVGAQIKFGDRQSNLPYVRVVGVVGQQRGFESSPEVKSMLRHVNQLGQILYLPGPSDSMPGLSNSGITFTARGGRDAAALPITLRRVLDGTDGMHITRVQSVDDYVGMTQARQSTRFLSMIFTLFAAIGVGLAAFGVYGVVAHSVAERRRELGVRIALGATARDILHAVLRESTVVALAGIAGGLLAVKFTAKAYMTSIARDDDLYSATLFASVALALGLAAVAAAMIPAMRATRVDPTESLRND